MKFDMDQFTKLPDEFFDITVGFAISRGHVAADIARICAQDEATSEPSTSTEAVHNRDEDNNVPEVQA